VCCEPKRVENHCPRQCCADRVNDDPNYCSQGVPISNSINRDRWRSVVEAAKVLQNHIS